MIARVAAWRTRPSAGGPTIGLLSWGNVVEDFLGPAGLTLEQFRDEFTGSWMFGWARALATAGVTTEIVVVSRAARATIHTTHGPTGAPLTILPAARAYRTVERRMTYPYGRSARQVFGWRREPSAPRRLLAEVVRELAPYGATPPLRLAAAARRGRWQALLCQEYEYPRFDVCALLGRALRLPVVAVFQGGRHQLGRLERVTRPVGLALAAGLIVGSESEAARVRARYGVAERRIARIPNPVDTALWRPRDRAAARAALNLAAGDRVVAWHGRVSIRHKGLDVLLDAWRELAAAGAADDLRLLLVGGGEDAAQLDRLVAEQSLPGVVRVDRHLHDPQVLSGHLAAADVYAFPSRHEGFAVAPLEAMACGLALVAADIDGVRELLPAGEESGGILVPSEQPAALAAQLARLLDDAVLRRALGERARARARSTFSQEIVGAQLRDLLLGGRPFRRR